MLIQLQSPHEPEVGPDAVPVEHTPVVLQKPHAAIRVQSPQVVAALQGSQSPVVQDQSLQDPVLGPLEVPVWQSPVVSQ